MMKHFTIAGNWKMHMTPHQAVEYLERFQKLVEPHTHVRNVICAPYVTAPFMLEHMQQDVVRLGVQDISAYDEGPYTGDIAGSMINQFAEYVIVGHSERRKWHHETDKEVAGKVAATVRNNLTAILCVGEKLDDREEGHSKRVVNDQLHGCLSKVTDEDMKRVIITYEPVWAISSGDGHGHFAGPKEVKPMVATIQNTVGEMFGKEVGESITILYGGSANPDNTQSYLEIDGVDGLLVGGASLNYEEFAGMIKIAQKLAG